MNEKILRALMHFAALVAQINQSHFKKNAHTLIKNFLDQKYGNQNIRSIVKNYLEIYNQYSSTYEDTSDLSSTAPLREIKNICTSLISELTINERLILLFSLLELIQADDIITREEADFTRNVAKELNIDAIEYEKSYDLIINKQPQNIQTPDYCIIYDKKNEISEELEGNWISKYKPENINKYNSIHLPGFEGKVFIVRFKQTNFLALKYSGNNSSVKISKNIIQENKYYIINPYDQLIINNTIFSYNDLIKFSYDDSQVPKIFISGLQFSVNKSLSKTSGDKIFNFEEESGNLVCLLGDNLFTSKIINALSGRNNKIIGKVLVNGYNLYSDYHKIQKYIGFVPNYPIFSKSSSIFENLLQTAHLAFPKQSDQYINNQVDETLKLCKLDEIRDIIPGNEIKGFSKSLQTLLTNLAIEFIRIPTILFIQTPFDYLNAPDCEIILQILRNYAQNGNLVFLTSFQPNSAILKFTDKLWIFDEDEYLIYNGKTTEVFSYFKSIDPNFAYHDEQCVHCGTLNPELLYQIIQQKAVDENGKLTVKRKIPPEEWNKNFKTSLENKISPYKSTAILPVHQGSLPDIDYQYWYFVKQIFKEQFRKKSEKLKEVGFLILLSIIIPLLMRSDWSHTYQFGKNPNIYAYLTISTLLLFIRGFVFAERFNHDEKSVNHHLHFKNLSYFSILNSHITWWSVSSFFCSFIYSFAGCYILQCNQFLLKFWLIFFVICMLGCLTGILISNFSPHKSFTYFWMLLIVGYNIIFNGITINIKDYPKFLHSNENVPVITDLSPIKWAIEGLAVELAINNPYEKKIYDIERKLEISMFNANYLIPAIQKKLIEINRNIHNKTNQKFLDLIKNEIKLLPENNPAIFPFEFVENITPESFNMQLLTETNDYLTYMQILLSEQIRSTIEEKKMAEKRIIDSIGETNFEKLKFENHNTYLYNLINNSQINETIVFTGNSILKHLNPLYLKPISNFGRSHLFAPVKLFNKSYYNTLFFNVFVLWIFCFIIYIAINLSFYSLVRIKYLS